MYSSGSAVGVADLLDKLADFCEDNGWTVSTLTNEGSGRRCHINKGGVYVNFRAYVNEAPNTDIQNATGSGIYSLAFNVGTGSSGSDWFNKTGVPVSPSSSKYMTSGLHGLNAAIPTYHFFAQNSGNSILAVVEYASGFYQYLGFGTLDKFGSYTGGSYFFGSMRGISNNVHLLNNFIPADGFFSRGQWGTEGAAFVSVSVDSETGWHWADGYTTGRDSAKRYIKCNFSRYAVTLGIQPNTVNSVSAMLPLVVSVERDANHNSSTLMSPLGEVPGVHYICLRQLTPGQQIVLGSVNYRVFPFYKKDGSALTSSGVGAVGHSGVLGFAVKE